MRPITRTMLPIALFACLVAARPASAQVPAIPPFDRADTPGAPPAVPGAEGEVQGRGPIHEGFAQPGNGVGRPSPVVPKQPPAPIPETPPDQRPAGDDVAWIPGYWSWDGDRSDFLWVSGFWRVVPAGRSWVPGYWTQTDDGWRWVSGLWASSSQPQSGYVPEPPASLDRGPSVPPPDVGYSYVPGTWLNDDARWLWQPGYYAAPRAGLVFTPSRYSWTPRGYLYNPGFWDCPLESRGVLFAPVYFGAGFAPAAGWAYRPSVAVDVGATLGSLWVGPGANNYAFGDYYAPRYAREGYRSWLAYGPAARDPLYGYYRNANRDNPSWRADLVNTHNGRLRGTIAAPPTTFAAQGRVRDASLRTVTPLSSYRNRSLRMTGVTPAEGRNFANAAQTARRGAGVRSAPPATSSPRSPYPGRTASTPGRQVSPAPSPRVAPRTQPRPVGTARSYAPQAQHYTQPYTARNAPPAQHYTQPAQHYTQPRTARYAPPAQHYAPPAQHYTQPRTARYAPPAQHYAPAPTARYSPPAQHYAPPAQHYAQPAHTARYAPPARSAPPSHFSAGHGRHR